MRKGERGESQKKGDDGRAHGFAVECNTEEQLQTQRWGGAEDDRKIEEAEKEMGGPDCVRPLDSLAGDFFELLLVDVHVGDDALDVIVIVE